jgi:hypothetical protein
MTSCFFTQEHGHDLNEAVNAYFNEGDRTTYAFILLTSMHLFT